VDFSIYNKPVILLNTHSCYSLLEGVATPKEMVDAAVQQGMPALTLTDHRLLTGAVEFTLACRQASIQPILGLEIDLAWAEGPAPLVLLAAGDEGWAGLCRLSSALALRPRPEEPCPLALVAPFSRDLIALSGDQHDPSGRRLNQLAEIFPDRLYVALQITGGGMHPLAALAQKLLLPTAAVPPVYYRYARQAGLQALLTAIRLNQPLRSLKTEWCAPNGAAFLSSSELQSKYHDFPAALAATEEIASRCKSVLPLGVPHIPNVPLPVGLNAAQYLRQKAEKGARGLYGEITPPIRQRLEHELSIIADRGFEPVFLIVEELIHFARQKGVPYSSRGSAASSLVAHCLGITGPDPLEHDLYFERFLNPARTTPPDIDTDLCSRRRDLVLEHVFKVYGEDRAAMVCTINRFRPRSALGDAAKALGLKPDVIRQLSAALPHAFFAHRQEEDEDGSPSAFSEIKSSHPQYQQVYTAAESLLGLPRHLSVHPGGMVVAPGLLTDLVPLTHSGSKGVIITQLDLDSIEALGLVKIDLLGIRGLTVLGDVAEAIYSWRRSEFSGPLQVLDAIPQQDEETSQRVETGQTIGCFQIESPGMRATLREIHARTPADILAALALYRPGPLTGGLKDAFVRRFKGEEEVQHIHPALEPLLKDTFGVILYQEQVLRIAHAIAGLSLADADLLRRAMSHFDPGKQMQYLKEKFIANAEKRSGIPPETGARIWELMAAFAGYGFPKAHAASYAQVGWRSAWCKTHFPAEFMAAVLANRGGYYSQRVYLSEARRMHLSIRPPHINFSRDEFSVVYRRAENSREIPVLYMGLEQVHELTARTRQRILKERPFHTFEDFLSRTDPRRQEAENLVLAGAFEGMGSIPDLLRRLEGGWRAGQMPLFTLDKSSEDWSMSQKMAAQESVLGISLEAHPLELYRASIAAAGAISPLEAASRNGQRVIVAGVRQSARRSRTAKGEWMMFLSLEDLEGMLDVVIFPNVYRQARHVLSSGSPLLVTGTVEMDSQHSELFLRAERVEKIG